MLKVKVQRYVAGKKPNFASSSSSESEPEQQVQQVEEIKAFSRGIARTKGKDDQADQDTMQKPSADELADPRFRRLLRAKNDTSEILSGSKQQLTTSVLSHLELLMYH
ncbi:unnamed protein product [Echinostoma caproni]|uniref:Uncharacterized protein n=1 Tax=Echinostoma caproni TaxID=27848 RepID=A0A183A2D5_9TREM|nr:unnamed protein product [Echinostoma caproni]